MLEAHDISAQRGPTRLFARLFFKVDQGEVLLITGANGSGKTTLLRMLVGLSEPATGEIRWNGMAQSPFAPALRNAVTFVGHQPGLKDELTAEENLAAAMDLADRPADREAIREALEAVALGRHSKLATRLLSQGQRRRIALARLALDRRPLWVLDEPLTALDASGSALLAQLVRGHVQAGGMAIAATHAPLALEPLPTRAMALS